MHRKFDSIFIIRLAAAVLLSLIPALYMRDLFSPACVPILTGAVVLLALPAEKLKLRLIPSLGCAAAIFFVIYTGAGALLALPQRTDWDGLFLHLAIGALPVTVLLLLFFGTTLAWIRSARWRTLEPAFATIAFCLAFWPQGNHSLSLFSHPLKAALVTMAFVFAQILLLLAVNRPKPLGRPLRAGGIFFPLLLAVLFFILRGYNALSVTNNGGLIQPTLFRFDFSPYLSLQNEIKLNDNLVMIVRTKEENSTTLLRRLYLSGWNPRKGFFETEVPGEQKQVTQVPPSPKDFEYREFNLRSPAEQEYFIVNFDPSSFISMDYPVSVTPYRIWDTRAFNGAYSVTSHITGFIPFELFDSAAPTGSADEGMSRETLAFYTSVDEKTKSRLEPLTSSLVADLPGYYDRILALTDYLRDGDYRYSLKPGQAPDGDQLSYFLFETKKGYCTYFAFSLCLMLRSIGIPSRVAAGFFIQPDSGALDYFPIRSNMAHAWVEVFFPNYGWISFDPTTSIVADGEDIPFSASAGGDEFFSLLNEIIGRRAELTPAEGELAPDQSTVAIQALLRTLLSRAKSLLPLLLASLLFLLYGGLALRHRLLSSFSRNPRRRILLYGADVSAKLARSGKKATRRQSRASFVESLDDPDVSAFFALEQKARFAPQCAQSDAESAKKLRNRICSRKGARFFTLFILCLSVTLVRVPAQQAPSVPAESVASDAAIAAEQANILERANSAIQAENWETAIELLTDGTARFPDNPTFPFTLGSLYYQKNLYEAALGQFTSAVNLGYAEPLIYSMLSDCSGYLNRDEDALAYLRTYLQLVPDDLYAQANFGWYCYKTNRLQEGILSLHQVIEMYGPDSGIYVGLGNLYTAAFNYAEAKKYYTLAINHAAERHQTSLLSVFYYNRSILEEIFYSFDDAYADTVESIAVFPRASGYLMQGELELRRLDFKKAIECYLNAHNYDDTPLASLGLADSFIQSGYPEMAQTYIAEALAKTDRSWIASYGTTIDQYEADLHKVQQDYYTFLRNREKYRIVHNFSTILSKSLSLIKYTALAWYHEARYRIQINTVASFFEHSPDSAQHTKGMNLYSNSYYYLAFNEWRTVAAPYLAEAARMETGYVPAARPSYLYEEGQLHRDTRLLDEAIATLNPEWEQNYLSKALAERILLTPKSKHTAREGNITQLYLYQPAAFRNYDIKLPVSFIIQGTPGKKDLRAIRSLVRGLSRAGFEKASTSPFSIILTDGPESISVSLYLDHKARTLCTQVFHKSEISAPAITDFINSFSTQAFRTELTN